MPSKGCTTGRGGTNGKSRWARAAFGGNEAETEKRLFRHESYDALIVVKGEVIERGKQELKS